MGSGIRSLLTVKPLAKKPGLKVDTSWLPPKIPIKATPGNSFADTTANTSANTSASTADSWGVPVSIVPTHATRVVPKKSKLSLLGSRKDGAEKEKDKGRKDFSDVVRCVGIPSAVTGGRSGSGTLRGGFEIYVDPTNDPDIGGTFTLLFYSFFIFLFYFCLW
jgi:hypothetical protein